MAIPKAIGAYLKRTKVSYKPLRHKTVFTAYDLAATLKTKLNEVAKTLHLEAVIPGMRGKKQILAVLPASRLLDLAKLKKALKASKLALAKESAMKKVFKVKTGALTPLGAASSKADVFIDRTLAHLKRCIISAGTFEDALEMRVKDLIRATSGKVAQFSKKR